MNNEAVSYVESVVHYGTILLNNVFGNEYIVSKANAQVNWSKI